MHEVETEVDALQYAKDGFVTTNVFTSNIPPFFSAEQSLNGTAVHSQDGRYRAEIEHHAERRGIRRFHEFKARYYKNEFEKQSERLESKRS